jgi:Fic family protein
MSGKRSRKPLVRLTGLGGSNPPLSATRSPLVAARHAAEHGHSGLNVIIPTGYDHVRHERHAWRGGALRGSFGTGVIENLRVTPALLSTLGAIREHKGKQELYKRTSPGTLETLLEVARIQSVESSNRIEGITAPTARINELVRAKTTPGNRSEAEIAGYRDALATIHTNSGGMRFTPGLVLQLNRDICRYLPDPGGRWKDSDNEIEETLADGSKRIRFTPVPAFQTGDAMNILHARFNAERDAATIDELVLVAAYTLDFLCIHPFSDGNGRMSRLLSLVLLYQADYEVGRYVSLERLVEQSKGTYVDALEASSEHWHDGTHNLLPWMEYFAGVILAAYRELEMRVGDVTGERGAKSQMVLGCIDRLPSSFRIADIERACPHVSRPTINRVLRAERLAERVKCIKRGRDATWEKAGS